MFHVGKLVKLQEEDPRHRVEYLSGCYDLPKDPSKVLLKKKSKVKKVRPLNININQNIDQTDSDSLAVKEEIIREILTSGNDDKISKISDDESLVERNEDLKLCHNVLPKSMLAKLGMINNVESFTKKKIPKKKTVSKTKSKTKAKTKSRSKTSPVKKNKKTKIVRKNKNTTNDTRHIGGFITREVYMYEGDGRCVMTRKSMMHTT